MFKNIKTQNLDVPKVLQSSDSREALGGLQDWDSFTDFYS